MRLGSLYEEGIDTVKGSEYAAYKLFRLIEKHHGRPAARRIFAMWGTAPTKRRLATIRNLALLDRYDSMKPKPNVEKLARQLAVENKSLPGEKRRGAGGTNAKALEKQIRRQIKYRDKHMKIGTWFGPIRS